MLQTFGAILAPFAVLAIQANFYPTDYAKCMQDARQDRQLSLEQHYASGKWLLDDAKCSKQ